MLLLLPALEKKYSKRSLMFFSVLLYIAGDLLIYAGRNSAACLLIGLVITGLGIYGIFGITFAMQPDVIDYSEYKKNASVSRLIAAFQGFFVKGGMGLTSFIIGAFLTYFYKLDRLREEMTNEPEIRRSKVINEMQRCNLRYGRPAL